MIYYDYKLKLCNWWLYLTDSISPSPFLFWILLIWSSSLLLLRGSGKQISSWSRVNLNTQMRTSLSSPTLSSIDIIIILPSREWLSLCSQSFPLSRSASADRGIDNSNIDYFSVSWGFLYSLWFFHFCLHFGFYCKPFIHVCTLSC